MVRIKMSISNVKLPFYPPCEVKCVLQNKRKTKINLELLPPNKSSLSWFWPFSLVNLVTTKPKLVSKPLKLKDQDQKMFLSEKYWLESVLWKTLSLIHFFLVNLVHFTNGIHHPLKSTILDFI